MNLDLYIFRQINQLAGVSPLLDMLATFFSEYLGYVLLVVLVILYGRDLKKNLATIIGLVSAGILSRLVFVNLLHALWQRPRPFVFNQVNLLVAVENKDIFGTPFAFSSFPSGHAAFYFAISTVVFLYSKKVYPASNQKLWCGAGFVFLVASFLISISRVFVGVHWPSDILVGAIIGVFSGWVTVYCLRKFSLIEKKKIQQSK